MNTFMRYSALLPLMPPCLLAAAEPSPSAATLVRPLVISALIQEQPGPMARCPYGFGGTITGHGDSALLGRVVFIATDCITPSGPLYNFSQGRLIIVTISGDQIFADYSGQFVPTGNGAAYVFSSASFQISGGNGQYQRATGGGTLIGGEDLVTGAGNLQLSGRISYK
jgi:hypothetical protein